MGYNYYIPFYFRKKIMSIKAFKLISGEDVITDLVKEEADYFVIKSPAVVVMQQTADGKVGVGLQPFAPLSEGSITLYKSALSATFDVNVQIENEYNRIFGSGIVIANAMPSGIAQ